MVGEDGNICADRVVLVRGDALTKQANTEQTGSAQDERKPENGREKVA